MQHSVSAALIPDVSWSLQYFAKLGNPDGNPRRTRDDRRGFRSKLDCVLHPDLSDLVMEYVEGDRAPIYALADKDALFLIAGKPEPDEQLHGEKSGLCTVEPCYMFPALLNGKVGLTRGKCLCGEPSVKCGTTNWYYHLRPTNGDSMSSM